MDKNLKLSLILTDKGTQFRTCINEAKVSEYSEMLSSSNEWPFDTPCEVFHDGNNYYLVDGFHRVMAAERARRKEICCNVRNGTLRDAIKKALCANARHGLHRSNEDKRMAVEFVLSDSEWGNLSSRMIAEMCGVSHSFVETIRKDLSGNGLQSSGNGLQSSGIGLQSSGNGLQSSDKRTRSDGREFTVTKRESEKANSEIAWEDVDDEPPQERQPGEDNEPLYDTVKDAEKAANEQVKKLQSSIKQYNAYMIRAVGDLHTIRPNKKRYDEILDMFRAIHTSIEAWK